MRDLNSDELTLVSGGESGDNYQRGYTYVPVTLEEFLALSTDEE